MMKTEEALKGLEMVREKAKALVLDPDLGEINSLCLIFGLLQTAIDLIDAQSSSHAWTLAKARELVEVTLTAFEKIEPTATSH